MELDNVRFFHKPAARPCRDKASDLEKGLRSTKPPGSVKARYARSWLIGHRLNAIAEFLWQSLKGELGYAGFVKIAEIDARLQQPYQPFTDT